MIDPSRTGQNIIACRQHLGWTQSELASRLNVTHQAVSKWETGAALPDISTLYDLSLLFGLSMELLLTGDAAGMTPVSHEHISPPHLKKLISVCEPESNRPIPSGFSASVSGSSDAFSWDELIALAPFSSRDTLNQMISACPDEFTPEHLVALAPFMTRDTLDRLTALSAEHSLSFDHLSCLAPFLGRQTLDRLVLSSCEATDWNQIISLAPFLSRSTLDRLVSQCPASCAREHLLCLAPFLSRNTLDRLIRESSRADTFTPSSSQEEPASWPETHEEESEPSI